MKKIIVGTFLLGLIHSGENTKLQDDYYAKLDANGETILAINSHKPNDDRSEGVWRKRIHKRKRKVRPPVQGK